MYHRGVKEEARRHGFSKPALISMEQWPVVAGLSSLPGILLSLGREGAPGVLARGVCILQLGVMVLRMGECCREIGRSSWVVGDLRRSQRGLTVFLLVAPVALV